MDRALLNNMLTIAATVAVVAIGLAIVNFVRRQVKAGPEGQEDLLAQFQEAHEAGEMDSAEFERVRESLTRQGSGASRPKTTPSAEPTPPPTVPTAAADAEGPASAPEGSPPPEQPA
jgi:hypothetical protein